MDAYVFFDKRRTSVFAPWHLFISPKWAHTFILIDYGKKTLVCDCLAGGLTFFEDLPIKAQIEHWKRYEGTAVVKVPMPKEYEERFRFRGLITCVSIIKAILCINSPFIVSPRGLFHYLIKNGGTVIFERK